MPTLGNKGNVAHYQRIPLAEQKSQFSRMLARMTDEDIAGYEEREKTRLELINDQFLALLKAEAKLNCPHSKT